MSISRTRSAKVWITADRNDYDIFVGQQTPSKDELEPMLYNPEWSMCKEGFRRLFGGLGLRTNAKPKQFIVTFEEISDRRSS